MSGSVRLSLIAALIALVAVLAGCDRGGDDSSTAAGKDASTATGASTATATTDDTDVDWPYFGRVEQRTQYIADAPDPPFHFLWQFFAKQLLEFPPALEDGFVFVVNKTGQVFVLNAQTGKVVRQADLDNDVTSPAYSDGTLYLAQTNGDLTALEVPTAKPRWTFHSDAELESSPLVSGGRVYLGSDDGHFYAIDAETGKQAWRVELGHDVKASPSIEGSTLYVGDYEGTVWALDADTGKTRWRTDTTKLPVGGDGGFYSSPSVAFGDVYEARTDGTVFALDADTGKLDWDFKTSNSIYSSPAAAQVPGTDPTIYVGSYDHQLYALDAQTGKKRWRFDVGGVVPGTPTVVGKTVYTSSFQNKKTFGVDAKTGKQVFEWGSAGFTPVISDGERVFLTGFQTVWAFDAKDSGEPAAASRSEPGRPPANPSDDSTSGK
jgi:outer membrane protein assembly factor BamB